MRPSSPVRFAVLSASLFGAMVLLGCDEYPYQSARQPPPPPAYSQVSANIDLAERNGFDVGRKDGERDAYYGQRFEPRGTRSYLETPGYNRRLGPFDAYANTFRNAYLRGYDQGFRHR